MTPSERKIYEQLDRECLEALAERKAIAVELSLMRRMRQSTTRLEIRHTQACSDHARAVLVFMQYCNKLSMTTMVQDKKR